MDTGLPDIDQKTAKALGERMRAVRSLAPVKAPAPPSEMELRAALRIYCQAWADLQSDVKTVVTLWNFDLGRDMEFNLGRLKALQQQIARLRCELGEPLFEQAKPRIWA